MPWYGRIYMGCITIVLVALLALALWTLGQADTRSYFGLVRTQQPLE